MSSSYSKTSSPDSSSNHLDQIVVDAGENGAVEVVSHEIEEDVTEFDELPSPGYVGHQQIDTEDGDTGGVDKEDEVLNFFYGM